VEEGTRTPSNNKSPDTIVPGLCTPNRREVEPIFRRFAQNCFIIRWEK